MNIIYELLAKVADVDRIKQGQEISVDVDIALAHDGSMLNIINELDGLSTDEGLKFGDKLHVTVDHFFPAPSIKARENFHLIKEFCLQHKIHLYSDGEGVLYQVIVEKFGDSLKDKIMVGVDGHMCTAAGFGAIPFSITASEMAKVLVTGKYNFTVPEIIKVELSETHNCGNEKNHMDVSGKDIGLSIIKELKGLGLKGKAILLFGNALKSINQSQKMTIGNILSETGIKTMYISENYITKEDRYTLKLNEVKPSISLPGSLETIVNVEDVEDVNISQVYIGGCTNGKLDDMENVATVLSNNKIHPNVTLIVCPASRKVANDMDRLGYSQIIRNSGGVIINPGCGACSGVHLGVISKKDVVVTTTPRNTRGRMGDEEGLIYLASPKTAANFALTGRITKL